MAPCFPQILFGMCRLICWYSESLYMMPYNVIALGIALLVLLSLPSLPSTNPSLILYLLFLFYFFSPLASLSLHNFTIIKNLRKWYWCFKKCWCSTFTALHSVHIHWAHTICWGGECYGDKVGIKRSGDTESSTVPLRYESPVKMKLHY